MPRGQRGYLQRAEEQRFIEQRFLRAVSRWLVCLPLILTPSLSGRVSITSDFLDQETGIQRNSDLPWVTHAPPTFTHQLPKPWSMQCLPISAQGPRRQLKAPKVWWAAS